MKIMVVKSGTSNKKPKKKRLKNLDRSTVQGIKLHQCISFFFRYELEDKKFKTENCRIIIDKELGEITIDFLKKDQSGWLVTANTRVQIFAEHYLKSK